MLRGKIKNNKQVSIFQFIFIILTVPVFLSLFVCFLLDCSCSVTEELIIQTIREQFMEWLSSPDAFFERIS